MADDLDTRGDWRTPADRARDIAQAKALREQASKGGLRFEVFLPSGLAEWMLDFVERVSRWYDQMIALPRSQIATLMKLGGGIARLLDRGGKRGRDQS